MTVEDLIKQLQTLPGNLKVRVHDSEWGSWPVHKGGVLVLVGEPSRDGAAWTQVIDGTEYRDDYEDYTEEVMIT